MHPLQEKKNFMQDKTHEINIIQSPPAQKTEYVAGMFNQISKKYDFINRLLSLGFDQYWRKKTIQFVKQHPHEKILDIATGTGDLAIKMARLNPSLITGIDISENMLEIAQVKWAKKKIKTNISFIKSSCEDIPFQNGYFDCATIAFGIRNFSDINKSLDEIYRILIHDGQLVILEFSKPRNKIIKSVYLLYFKRILPVLGKVLSKNTYAYRYLPASVAIFPEREEFSKMLYAHGFVNMQFKTCTFGIVTIYQCFAKKQ